MTEAEFWTVRQVAEHLKITPATWRSYVSNGIAPQPDDPDEGSPPERRRPRWKPDTVKNWHAARPGKGGRPKKRTDQTADKQGEA